VPPLALPDLQHLPPVTFLTRVEAVRLFVTRAQAVQPDFSITSANGAVVAAICHRLDGLPLAIELAASRVRLLPLAGMLARLERRLPLLTGGARDAPARHHTLRAAIGWSYDLLGADEQRLFRRLAVFVGGCTLEAAEAVCGGADSLRWNVDGTALPALDEGSAQFLEAVVSLVDKSLLRHERPRQNHAENHTQSEQGRIYMLETIREYALEQLAASDEAGEIRLAHAKYYLALAEEAETRLVGPHQPAWLARLEEEHDNLRAVLAWAVEGGDPEIGLRVAAALWRFWFTRGHLGEGRLWFEKALAAGSALPPALRARALNGAGRLALRQGDAASAQAILEESLALWRSSPGWSADRLERGEMQTLHSLGLVAIYKADFKQAQRYFEQNLAGWRALGDDLGIAQTLNNLGLALRYQDKFEAATEVFEESLALTRKMQDQYGVAAVLHNLGQMAHHSGDDARAHRLLSESVVIGRQIGDRPNNSARLADLAAVWAAQGEPERAARLFGAAEVLRESTGANMYGGQRSVYKLNVEQAAAQMDSAAWEAAWAEGRAMSLDDAYDLALEELHIAPATLRSQSAPIAVNAYDLSERELEVLRLLAGGLTYAQIGERLTLSYHTVHAHLRSIYAKLGVTSRSQATRFARQHKLT
jgi:non-specific serine/threonine protein kinase